MCVTCGCGEPNPEHKHESEHEHGHGHAEERGHEHLHGRKRGARSTIQLERALLSKNQRFADENRAWLAKRSCVAFNLMGSPGAGKTALLEAVVRRAPELGLSVV